MLTLSRVVLTSLHNLKALWSRDGSDLRMSKTKAIQKSAGNSVLIAKFD